MCISGQQPALNCNAVFGLCGAYVSNVPSNRYVVYIITVGGVFDDTPFDEGTRHVDDWQYQSVIADMVLRMEHVSEEGSRRDCEDPQSCSIQDKFIL